ncbi:snRNA-activating protein complex subunit 1-like isoform X3 [Stylophora pistillata]|uniref:snRNA-activating protein complex subunit 1-like isoform X3 n=1 Tax=Stylophora pistillata TaxID=50429 RepID=UPI000C03AB32|nr:snRNA-activating protein complex subunit 1-like isoform X3 [Stylophora pistillata]
MMTEESSTYLESTPSSFQCRIGALYALYAVYHTQLCQPKVKIRMTLSMMRDLKELHKQIIEQKHHDADYILRLLNNENAFLFVAMPIPLSYGSRETITGQDEGHSSTLIEEVNETVEERFRAMENLEEAHNNYKELKNKLQETGLITGDRSFKAISEETVTDVASELQKFGDWKRMRCQKHVLEKKTGTSLSDANSVQTGNMQLTTTANDEASPGTSALSQENISKSSRIKDIKKRSFSTAAKVTRSMRHLQPTIESTDDEGSKSKRKRAKK